MNALRFMNDVMRPWDSLNRMLCQNLALQVDLSDITRLAGTIATSIRHQPEAFGMKDKDVNAQSLEHRVVADAGDYWKHGELRNADRNCPLTTASLFEYSEHQGFRFIRNAVLATHNSLGEFDFMEVSSAAVKFWMGHHFIQDPWDGLVYESDAAFEPTARLRFDRNSCIQWKNIRTKFFTRNAGGVYVPVEPPEVRIDFF